VDVLYVLQSFSGRVFARGEVAVGDGEVGGVDLQEEEDGALVAQTVLEARLDLEPLVLLHPVEQRPVHEDEGGHPHHVVAGEVDERPSVLHRSVVQVLLYDSPPPTHHALVVAQQHVVGVQLYHLLQTDHHHVRFI
jgi:hypothetical protein